MVEKVCVIGAGPSGLGILCWFAKQKREGKVVINIVVVIIIIIINIVATVTITQEEKRRGVESLGNTNICGTCHHLQHCCHGLNRTNRRVGGGHKRNSLSILILLISGLIRTFSFHIMFIPSLGNPRNSLL